MGSKIHWYTGFDFDLTDRVFTWYNRLGKEIELPVLEKEGYEFAGWYNYDPNFTNVLEKIDYVAANDCRVLYLYACWKKDGNIVECYDNITTEMYENAKPQKTDFKGRISYYCGINLTNDILQKCRFNFYEEFELPIPKREGNTFGGWYGLGGKKDNIKLKPISKIDKNNKKANYKLFAKWIDSDGNVDDCYDKVKPSDFEQADKISKQTIA